MVVCQGSGWLVCDHVLQAGVVEPMSEPRRGERGGPNNKKVFFSVIFFFSFIIFMITDEWRKNMHH